MTEKSRKNNPKRSVSFLDFLEANCDEFFTTEEVAGIIGVKQRTVQNWINGKGTRTPLKAFRVGKITRITQEDLKAFIKNHYSQGAELVQTKYRTSRTARKVDQTIQKRQKQHEDDVLRKHKIIQ